jgi:hypothetical protein
LLINEREKLMSVETQQNAHCLTTLLEKNQIYAQQYQKNPLMQLITSQQMRDKNKREKLLDCLQTFSDFFQKATMLRYLLCDNKKFLSVTEEHLKEEFGHNFQLRSDRKNRLPVWDSILDASAAWFCWKMFTLNEEEKTILMHLVLEASALIFFQEAHQVMTHYGETEYFETHSSADEEHEKMGVDLLENLTIDQYQKLLEIQKKGWEMVNTVCARIAHLVENSNF